MVSCAVRSCPSRTGVDKKETTGITFHRFPKDSARCEVWEKFVKRSNWKPTKYSVLCSKHFSDPCFDKTSQCTIRLRHDAIPSLNQGETVPLSVRILPLPVVVLGPIQVNDPEPSKSYSLPSIKEEPMTPYSLLPIKEEPMTPYSLLPIKEEPMTTYSLLPIKEEPMTPRTVSKPLRRPTYVRKLLKRLQHAEEVSATRKRKLILLRRQVAHKNKIISTMKNIIAKLKKKKSMEKNSRHDI